MTKPIGPHEDILSYLLLADKRQKELIEMKNELTIHIDQIPDFRRIELAKGALALTEQVFSMPGAEERYQAWLKEHKAKHTVQVG